MPSAGADPDYARRDLFVAIASGNYPSWLLKIQLLNEYQVDQLEFNPFDATKVYFIH